MKQVIKPFSWQNGVTLISLLVGSMISVIIIISGLTFYKYHIAISMGNAKMSSYTANLKFLMTVFETELTNVGFGLDPGVYDPENIIVTLYNPANEFTVAWIFDANPVLERQVPTGTPHEDLHCRGIQERILKNDQNQDYSQIFYVEASDADCQFGADLRAITWNIVEPIVAFENADVDVYIKENGRLFTMTTSDAACMPFGLSDADGSIRKVFNLTGVFFTGLTKGDTLDPIENLRLDVCLPNIRV